MDRLINAARKFDAVDAIAKSIPWLSPIPSAYFVARSGMAHLSLPLPVAIVVAAIIETLGLATVNSALVLYDWNVQKRKNDPKAPTWIALALAGVYIIATLLLVVFLEVFPFLATYAPGLFPFLAIVGAVNLAVLSQHKHRVASVDEAKAEAKAGRERRKREKEREEAEAALPPTQVAQVSDWRLLVNDGALDHMNGDRLDATTVAEILAQNGYAQPSMRAMQGWAKNWNDEKETS